MQRLSFTITILGLFALLAILILPSPLKVFSLSQINSLEDNTKILIEGKIIKQTPSALTLNNSLILQCPSCPPYANKTIQATAIIEHYQNRTLIKVLTLKEYAN